jgi:hypothetical protein
MVLRLIVNCFLLLKKCRTCSIASKLTCLGILQPPLGLMPTQYDLGGFLGNHVDSTDDEKSRNAGED